MGADCMAEKYAYVTYTSPDQSSSTGQTAQNYMDGVLQYWDQHAKSHSEDSKTPSLTSSNEMDFKQDTPSSKTHRTLSTASQPVIPQLQTYHQNLLALEQQSNVKRARVARERQSLAQIELSQRDQRNAAARKAHATAKPPIESYKSYLVSVQAQSEDRLQQVREDEEEREAEERKRELERIIYMRRKDSGIYCDTIIKGYDGDDCPLPEEMECDDVPFARRDSRIGGWVDAQAKRRLSGMSDDVMLPKKYGKGMDARLSVHDIFSDSRRPSMVGFEKYHEQIMEQRRRAERERERAIC